MASSLPPPKTFFSYELDTVIFSKYFEPTCEMVGRPSLFRYLCDNDLYSIQNMMIMVRPKATVSDPGYHFGDQFPLLRSLRKVTILFAYYSTRQQHTINASPVEELAIGDDKMDPHEFSDFTSITPPIDTPAAMTSRFTTSIVSMNDYLKEMASVAGWAQVPVATLAKPKYPGRFVGSILDLCF